MEQLDRHVDGRTLLDRCQDLGITVMAGIWVQHERHGFDYSDPLQVRRQREEVRAAVRKFKNHPAILIWGLGNEMEGPSADGRDPRIWRELEELARIVKEEDPDHPVCTVIAGAAAGKVKAMMRDYPSIDILGVNAYAGAAGVGTALAEAGWNKPFILAEYGPVGHWEVRQTPWGAPSRRRRERKRKTTSRPIVVRCRTREAFVWGPSPLSGARSKRSPRLGMGCFCPLGKNFQQWTRLRTLGRARGRRRVVQASSGWTRILPRAWLSRVRV